MNETIHAAVEAVKLFLTKQSTFWVFKEYRRRFNRFSFIDCRCKSVEQFQASIIRLNHTIEKGLSYENYRPGFGSKIVNNLVLTLEQYSAKKLDTTAFCYQTAYSSLLEYIKKNKEHGYIDENLEKRIIKLDGKPNEHGGAMLFTAPIAAESMNYEELMKSRHSIRHFSPEPVDLEQIKKAVSLAQFTPSACNRQGWKTRIINDRRIIGIVLANQNGNRGFGQEIDKLLIVTADLRAQQKKRELFQAFIDGGMYAESVLNALFYYGIGSIPLSASLTPKQEKVLKTTVGIDEAEVLILIIGIGNYPKSAFNIAKSERNPAEIVVL